MYDMKPSLEKIDGVIKNGPFQDNWESLSRFKTPAWYQNAKFGIFIHWGIYSVPGFGSEWYSRNMYIQGSPEFEHHVKTYGPQKEFGYKDFIPMFKAEKFDPDQWADLFAEAGAKYVVPVAEHHDGFQMYRSEISHWNAYEMGPHRDVLGELGQSLARRGIVLGASSHRVEHWFFMSHGKEFDSDIREPLQRGDFYWPAMPEQNHMDLFSTPAPTEEFLQDWLVRTCEIIDRYQPRLLYFDWWIQHSAVKPYLKKLAAYYYNRAAEWGVEAAIDYKHEAFMFGTAVPDVERGRFAQIKPFFWQTDTAIARNSWGYTRGNDYKPAKGLIQDLVDIVSKNGALLLNVGPMPNGEITPEETAVLREIGAWLRINGEAIYNTHIWRQSGEGPTQITEGQFTEGQPAQFTAQDLRFTMNGACLYATVLEWPKDGNVVIRSLADADAHSLPVFHGIVKEAGILGHPDKIAWHRDGEGLHVHAPQVQSDLPVVIRLRLD